jgi:hypothetical protein
MNMRSLRRRLDPECVARANSVRTAFKNKHDRPGSRPRHVDALLHKKAVVGSKVVTRKPRGRIAERINANTSILGTFARALASIYTPSETGDRKLMQGVPEG